MSATGSLAAKAAFFIGILVFGNLAAVIPASATEPWTGFYVGLNAGYGWSRTNSSLEGLLYGTPTPFDDEIPASYRISSNGFIGGGQIGYNFQINKAVLGIETDFAFSGIKGDATATGPVTSGSPPTTQDFISTRSQSLHWFSTLRGRLGYTPDNLLLLYATGGLAFGRYEDSMRLSFLGVGGSTFAGSETLTRTGWTLGGGVEYRISGNFTAKLEYLYFDLGSATLVGLDVKFPNQPFQSQSQFDHNGHLVRVGLNYKFGASR